MSEYGKLGPRNLMLKKNQGNGQECVSKETYFFFSGWYRLDNLPKQHKGEQYILG